MSELDNLYAQIAKKVQVSDKDDLASLCFQFLDKEDAGPRAEKVAQLLVRVEPRNADAYNLLGLTLFHNDKQGEAGKAYTKAVQLNPKHGMAWNNFANALQKTGMLPEALEYFENALQCLDKKYHHAIYVNMANVYLWQADMGRAYECAQKAYHLKPDNASVNSLLGNLCVEKGDQQEAEKYFLHSLKSEKRTIVLDNLCRLYDRIGDIEKAKKYSDMCVEHIKKTFHVKDVQKLPENLKRIFYLNQVLNNSAKENQHIVLNDNLDNCSWNKIAKRHKLNKHYQIIKASSVQLVANDWNIFDRYKIFCNFVFFIPTWGYKAMLSSNHQGHTLIRKFEQEEHQKEPVIFIGGASNYYHWICDYLPRIQYIDALPEMKNIPILINSDFTNFQKESLQSLGVDLRRFQTVTEKTQYKIDQIYLVHRMNRPLTKNKVSDWMNPALGCEDVIWLRSAYSSFMTPKKEYPKRLFMSRKNAKFRICLNEDKIYEIAREYGFEKVHNEDMSFTDQIALYSGVEAVMGVHGAGFTNMVFAPQSATLIEMHPRNELPEFYKNIASILGQKHIGIDGIVTRALPPLTPPFWNFEIDPKKVRAVLEKEFG